MEPESLELSSKITKSVCVYLEAKGIVAGDYLEAAGIPPHKALDPEMWIPCNQIELFLDLISRDVQDFHPKEVALNASELRGWGLLDQVLRILQSASEIYEHPQKFLSYFIRPNLNFEWVERKASLSSFTVSLSADQFPLVVDYLTGALEVVTQYVGSDSSIVNWFGTSISIDWSKKQENFFEQVSEPVNFKPEIYKEAVEIIQRQQSEILAFKSNEGKNASVNMQDVSVKNLAEDLKILSDYFLRARQLVSLLKAESGNKKWYKEAVKRLNWDELQGLHNKRIEIMKSKLEGRVEVQKDSLSGEQIGLDLDTLD